MTAQALLAPARLARKPILASQSDERLVDLVRAGYEPAFEAIVARYRGPLARYCRRFLPESRAEDVLQQTFVNAYGAMKKGRGELRLRAWLYRIAHNAAINALRDRALRHEQLHERLDGVERPDQALERRQGLREALAAVQALPARQRDALLLRELEGRSYEQIAAELGVSDGAVRQLLNRARTRLRDGATAVTPVGLIIRLPWREPGESLAARLAEVCGGGAGVVATKLCATALVTGALIGGVAAVPRHHGRDAEAQAADGRPPSEGTSDPGGPGDSEHAGDQGARDVERRWLRHAGSSTFARAESEAARGDRQDTSGGDDDRSGSGGDADHPGGGAFGSGDGSDESGTSGSGPDDSGPADSGTSGSEHSGSDESGSGDSGSGDSGSSGPGGGDDTITTVDGNSGPGSSDGSGSRDALATDSSTDGR